MKQYRALIISCILLVIVTVFAVAFYGKTSAADGLNNEKKGATDITAQRNHEVYTQLDFSDTREQEFAKRGMITALEFVRSDHGWIILDYIGIMMDSDQLADQSFTVNLQLADDENYLLKIHHGVLLYYPGEQDNKADVTIQTRKLGIPAIAAHNEDNIGKLVTSVEGDQELYKALCDSMVSLKLYFNIAEP